LEDEQSQRPKPTGKEVRWWNQDAEGAVGMCEGEQTRTNEEAGWLRSGLVEVIE